MEGLSGFTYAQGDCVPWAGTYLLPPGIP